MQKPDTKQSLISAVKELILSGESFTVKDISEMAYTNIAAINYHFGSKNALVNLALDEMVENYRVTVVNELKKDYGSSIEYADSFLNLIADKYSVNKGVIKFIVSTDTGDKSRLVDRFLFDEELTDLVYEKMEKMTGTKDPEVQLSNYLICLSAFIMPLLFECQSDEGGGGKGVSMLLSDDMRGVFVSQLIKLFS